MFLANEILERQFAQVRSQSIRLCQPLELEDHVIQPMENASPPKWHLAHVTWFFETFLLKPYLKGYVPFNTAYEVLFNSYYYSVGKQHPQSKRGHLSRPTLDQVMAYRHYIDAQMQVLLARELNEAIAFKVVLGLHHEQQHQELLLTDIKYNLGTNPLHPSYVTEIESTESALTPLVFLPVAAGLYQIGRDTPSSQDFAFDNESPRHDVLVREHSMSNRLITNGEYLTFFLDGGYQRPELWLADAWTLLNHAEGFTAPLYWLNKDGQWFEYTLYGLQPLNPVQPVCHISGYEADAYARWAGARLPTEQEWEVASNILPITTPGNFVESNAFHPKPAQGGDDAGLMQISGDLWEWTSSSYSPYPGFQPFPGVLGEYNGKFMANQWVLKGGSCATPETHYRNSYRNFFYAKDRWQFTGVRLARD